MEKKVVSFQLNLAKIFQLHTEDMNIEYSGCGDRPGICSNILTSCSLQKSHAVLSPGQSYNIGKAKTEHFIFPI